MKEYFVEKPMPQFGKDIYSCIPIPNEIVAEIRADAIDEYQLKLLNVKAENISEVNGIIVFKKKAIEIAEQLKEKNK